MKDRFLIGFFAGVIGGLAAALISIPLYMLKIAKFRLIDFSAILILGKAPHGTMEIIFGILLHWGFSGAVGVFFAYLVNRKIITDKNLWFKGWFFGLGFWFLINIATTIFKVPNISAVPVGTAIVNALASSLFGIMMGLSFKWLNNKAKSSRRG